MLRSQKYHLVGRHSAVKRCRWLHETLVNERPCYKQKFYGIKTHRCVQMTPAVHYCNMHCRFCWRVHSGDKPDLKWKETPDATWDEPEQIVEACITGQKKILSGYKGNPQTDRWKGREQSVRGLAASIACSAAELGPPHGELIRIFHK